MEIRHCSVGSSFVRFSIDEKRIDGDEETETKSNSKFIRGYGAVFYNPSDEGNTEYKLWDGAVERIMPGAFDAALKRGDDVRLLFNHDSNLILGRTISNTLDLGVDEHGLFYRAELGGTTVAKDVFEHVTRGDVTGSSFAFQVTDQEWRTENDQLDVREIRGVELFDVGPVVYPAYSGTSAMMAVESSSEEGHRLSLLSDVENSEARKSWREWKNGEARKRLALQARIRVREIQLNG